MSTATVSREAPFVAVYLGGAAGLSPDAIPLARPDPAPEPFALPVVAVAGDFDGDGSMDVAAGAPLPPGAGRVFVWSAIDAAPVELSSPTERVRAGFGSSLATTTF